ncbi:hypothetical protein DSLASN_02190 [Desulfoluna limicola]|uniref:Uncharacterized protein n=1 Tax=Desulfoluna limicola TaxID=2810562 RepID=A0ABN6EW46_9BACT|nr:hypothetical protein [Desulfoluna limicola]BCS94587.1 hypothetical protein DSLASN_02190 [Desulfoluna limicola]
MARRREKLDPSQRIIDFTWGQQVDRYVEERQDIQAAIEQPRTPSDYENEFEYGFELATAIKKAIRQSGLSREQVVDEINAFFDRSHEGAKTDPPSCRNPLTINMLNKYICKPDEAPIPAYYLVALMFVTGSLEPARALVEPMGAQVVDEEDVKQLTLGKIDQNISELQRLKKELRGVR